MFGLLFLGKLWIKLITADSIDSFPNARIGLDIVIHHLNVSQLHILLFIVVQLLVSRCGFFSQHKHSHPNGVHFNCHFISFLRDGLSNFFKL